MALFSRRSSDNTGDAGGGRPSVTALVVSADAPPQGAPRVGMHSHGSIRVLVDTPTGRRQLGADFRFADDHWLAPGMEAPVFLDPAHPDTFEVDWSNVPLMKAEVEADHPALADPFATSRRIAEALGITPSSKTAAQLERFQKALADSTAKTAPAGRLRGVAIVATVRGRFGYYGGGDDDHASESTVELTKPSAAVLSVALPGKPPYAAYLPKFTMPRRHSTLPGEPMAVTVSQSDPQDVDILWDEQASIGEQINTRIASAMGANSSSLATMSQQIEAAQAAAIAQAQGGASAPPAGTTPAPPDAMRQMLVDNLKRSLVNVTDPAVRAQMVAQYRTMGVEISPEELAP